MWGTGGSTSARDGGGDGAPIVSRAGRREAHIDGLRALAVVAVVLFHAEFSGFSGGFGGVDIFFVLSGFLIARLLAPCAPGGAMPIGVFFDRRIRRIVPALLALCALCLVAGAFFLLPSEYARLGQAVTASVTFLANAWFWRSTSDYFSAGAAFEPLLHTWSLAVEVQVYVLAPLFFALFRNARAHWCGPALALVTGLSFLAAVWADAHMAATAFYGTPFRLWEFGMGGLLALVPSGEARADDRWRNGVAAMGLALIGASFILPGAGLPGPEALPACLGAAALLWADGPARGAGRLTLVGRVLAHPAPVALGGISYALYLWHWPLLTFPRMVLGTGDLPLGVLWGVLALSVLLAALSTRFVERPFRQAGRGPAFWTSRGALTGAMAGLVLCAAGGAALWRADGLASRLPEPARVLHSARTDHAPQSRVCLSRPVSDGLCTVEGGMETPDRADYLLWGDSHADAVRPAFAAVSARLSQVGVFAGKSACPPVLGLNRADRGPGHRCAAFNADVIAWLQDRSDMPVVILVGRWALNALEERAPGEGSAPIDVDWVPYGSAVARLTARPDGGAPATLDAPVNLNQFERAFSDTVAALRATGRRVVILGDVPVIGWSVPEALARDAWLGITPPPAPRLTEWDARTQPVDALFARLSDDPGVEVRPLADHLCAPMCRTRAEGLPLYRDRSHFTATGAERLIAPLFEDILRPEASRD